MIARYLTRLSRTEKEGNIKEGKIKERKIKERNIKEVNIKREVILGLFTCCADSLAKIGT